MQTPISKAQQRAIRLLNLANSSDYSIAAETLEAAGFNRDGLPNYTTWREADRMSDEVLVSKMRESRELRFVDEDTTVDGFGGVQ